VPLASGRTGTRALPFRRAETRKVDTRPFLHWKTRVVQVKRVPAGFRVSYDSTYVTGRETCIGTIDVGYSDGYSRLLSHRGIMLINGKRRRVAGRVTMNFIAVDLGPDGDVKPGDEVVLLGAQGRESIWADELAALSQTIAYEVLTSVRTDDRRVV
jgi:alanine racemase